MSGRFHQTDTPHDIGAVPLDWTINDAIKARMAEARVYRLIPGRHRPARVNARLRRARLRAERGAA